MNDSIEQIVSYNLAATAVLMAQMGLDPHFTCKAPDGLPVVFVEPSSEEGE